MKRFFLFILYFIVVAIITGTMGINPTLGLIISIVLAATMSEEGFWKGMGSDNKSNYIDNNRIIPKTSNNLINQALPLLPNPFNSDSESETTNIRKLNVIGIREEKIINRCKNLYSRGELFKTDAREKLSENPTPTKFEEIEPYVRHLEEIDTYIEKKASDINKFIEYETNRIYRKKEELQSLSSSRPELVRERNKINSISVNLDYKKNEKINIESFKGDIKNIRSNAVFSSSLAGSNIAKGLSNPNSPAGHPAIMLAQIAIALIQSAKAEAEAKRKELEFRTLIEKEVGKVKIFYKEFDTAIIALGKYYDSLKEREKSLNMIQSAILKKLRKNLVILISKKHHKSPPNNTDNTRHMTQETTLDTWKDPEPWKVSL